MHLVNRQELVEVKNARRAAAGEKSQYHQLTYAISRIFCGGKYTYP